MAAAYAHRVEEVLVEAAAPSERVELAEEAVAAVHVFHRAHLGLLRLGQPGVLLAAGAHELLCLSQPVRKAGHESWDRRACRLARGARAREQALHKHEHAGVRLSFHMRGGVNRRRGAGVEYEGLCVFT